MLKTLEYLGTLSPSQGKMCQQKGNNHVRLDGQYKTLEGTSLVFGVRKIVEQNP